MNYKKLLLAGGLAAVFMSCEKNLLEGNIPQRFPNPEFTSFVKYIHAYSGKSPALTTGAGPNLYLYLSDSMNRINGNFWGFSQSGGQYPAPSTAATNARSWYTAMPVGNYSLIGVLARVTGGVPTPIAGDTVVRANITLAPGKFYTIFLSDTLITTTSTRANFTRVDDDWGTIGEDRYKIRLANFMAWPDDIQELYSTRERRVIQDNISFKGVGSFVDLPVQSIGDTLLVRKVSGSSPVPVGTVFLQINGFSPTKKRAYTIFTRGRNLTGTSTVFQNNSSFWTTNF